MKSDIGLHWSQESGIRPEAPPSRLPDTKALLRDYVRRFNAADEELYANAIPNAEAEDFLLENIPRFACPDKDIERTYYFRWRPRKAIALV
jgi:hypothetical protein